MKKKINKKCNHKWELAQTWFKAIIQAVSIIVVFGIILFGIAAVIGIFLRVIKDFAGF